MYEFSDRKATGRRHTALVFAILLHLALGAALYFSHTGQDVNSHLTSPDATPQNGLNSPTQAAKLP